MADETPQPPSQPNGIRLVKPGAPGAQPTIRLKPIVPRPAPVGAAATPAAPAAPAAASAPAPAAPAADPASTPTVRLKPVAPVIKPAGSTVNLKPTPPPVADDDLSATIQISAPPPVAPAGTGIRPATPLAPTPATPIKSEQLQASKSKTSRISLDAALSAGTEPGGPRTIRIKRPTDAPVGKLTSHIPPAGGAVAPDAGPSAENDVPLSQRRTIRVKRPTSGPAAAPAPAPAAAEAAPAGNGEVVAPEFATDVPPPAFSGFDAGPAEKVSPAFPVLGLLAVAAFAVAIFFLLKGDANLFNPALWPAIR